MKDSSYIGMKFGRWTIVKECPKYNHARQVFCRCDCGKEKTAYLHHIIYGKSKSCGCLSREASSNRFKRHGLTGSKIHYTWLRMRQRCLNPSNTHYKYYGGRGITICKEWLESFEAFCAWAFANGFAPDLSIERINNDGNYEPSNCTWIPMKDQAKNKRHNQHSENNGMAKLKNKDIPLIRKDTRPSRIVAAEFGVSKTAIKSIRRHRTWNHVA